MKAENHPSVFFKIPLLHAGFARQLQGLLGAAAAGGRRQLGMGIHFVLLISRQGKVRLTKWYSAMPSKERARTVREVSAVVLARQQKQCNFLEYKDKKIIYKRCAHGLAWPCRATRAGAGQTRSPARVALCFGGADPAALPRCCRRRVLRCACTGMRPCTS